MRKFRAVSFLLVVLVLATTLASAAPLLTTANSSTPRVQSVSSSVLSYLQVILFLLDTDLGGIVAPFEPPAGIVER